MSSRDVRIVCPRPNRHLILKNLLLWHLTLSERYWWTYKASGTWRRLGWGYWRHDGSWCLQHQAIQAEWLQSTADCLPVDTVWHSIRHRSCSFLVTNVWEQEACGPSRVRHCATRQFRFKAGSLENFQVTYSVYPHSVAVTSTQPLTEMSTKEFPWR